MTRHDSQKASRRVATFRAALSFGASLCLFLGLSLGLASSEAQADNDIVLSPAALVTQVVGGDLLPYDLTIDFDDATFGGGIVVTFDPAVAAFVDFSWDPGFADEPALRLVCPSVDPRCVNFPGPGVLIAFANSSGIAGPQTVGVLTMDGVALGSTTLVLDEDADGAIAGPFVPFGITFDPPLFSDALLFVPEPASGGLLAGLCWLSVLGSRRLRALTHP